MIAISDIFHAQRALVGMIHLLPLPGTPRASLPIEAIVENAVREACHYRDAGFSGLLIENMHDRPYEKGAVGPEVVAAMTAAGRAVRAAVELPLGIQVLAGANREALAVALGCGAAFVRVEGFVFAHVADEGIIQSGAAELLRYRRHIGAEHIRIFADIKKKHSAHAITQDVSLTETARAAEFFLADGVIITGTATGEATDPAEVDAVRHAVRLPVLVGSGVTPTNLAAYASADALIVGSSLKRDGIWSNPLEPARATALAAAFSALPAPALGDPR
jgi:membrane complex biogenesis BtpA family protein